MLPPLPRCSGWAYSSLVSPSRVSLPRKGRRVGLHIVLFEACSAFTRVAACTLARSPIRDPLPEGFRHFVSSMPAPVASGWSESPGGACTHWKAPPYHGAHRNADTLEDKRIAFRIGINLGDVISDRGDIYGDGVNIAARLETLAEPGGICISRTVRDHIRDKLPYIFEDRGEQTVKNIARPVRVYAMGPAAVASVPVVSSPAQTASGRSIG